MELAEFLRYSESDLRGALERTPELSVTVAEEAVALVRRAEGGGYLADLRVKGNTVVLVRQDELDRFRQRLKEQIAIHVSRDRQPDLTEP